MVECGFIDTIDELADSVLEFHDKPEFWKAILGSGSKYFVHIKKNGIHIFGLSKFCAFKNIIVEEYLKTCRYKSNGGITQKRISRLTQQEWKPRAKIKNDVRKSFDKWISEFFPNYNLDNASFITISGEVKQRKERKKIITPKCLEDILKYQREIGQVGEEIAILYEIKRLKSQGVADPFKYVDQVSLRNSAAGYDIYSSTKYETRYIEVKSSLNNSLAFFITENEVKTLEIMENEAYLYLVYITNLIEKKGSIVRILVNPIRELREKGELKPIAYRAEINAD